MGVNDEGPPWGHVEHSDYTALETRVGRLEATVAHLLWILAAGTDDQHQRVRAMLPPETGGLQDSVTDQQPWQQEARRLAGTGQKLRAIKVVREATGMGLKEAKEYVERTY